VGWTFGDGTGVSGRNSAFTAGNQIPDLTGSDQVLFIQNRGVISQQTVSLPAGTYVVTLSAVQRQNYQVGTQTIKISVNGTQRGLFTPTSNGDLQNYSTAPFTIGTTGTKTLTISGVGSGTDYTSFIDNVAISKVTTIAGPPPAPISSDVNTGSTCDNSKAHFSQGPYIGTGFALAVLYMANNIVSANPSWYDASPNTLLTPNSSTCNRGPYRCQYVSSPYPYPDCQNPQDIDPNGSTGAQSTFQLLGTQAGFLMLSRDADHSGPPNPQTLYGLKFGSPPLAWTHPGDSIEIEASMRMTMFNPAGPSPVGQYYVAFNVVSGGSILEFSVLAYDSRPASANYKCDNFPSGVPIPIIGTSFDNTAIQASCGPSYPKVKYAWVPVDSTGFRAGDSGPSNGAWYTLQPFKVRLTREDLSRAINDAIARGASNIDTNPANYTLAEVEIIQEMVWASPDAVDMASSLQGLTVNTYRSY
jgi:hypothetical protein